MARSVLLGLFCLLFCTALLVEAGGLYDSKDKIVELTGSNFRKNVVHSDGIWLVEFYAPWCGHCKSLVPEWRKAAKALAGIVQVGAVNADEEQNKPLAGQYGIQGFPTIKLFGIDKNKPIDYQGARSAKDIVEFAMKEARRAVSERLNGKSSSSGSSSSSSGSSSGSSGSSGSGNGAVIHATEKSFQKDVVDNDDLVLVEFYAPWCGHCKNLEPHWKAAAKQLGGVARLVAVDATVHQSLAGKFGIRGYPTIKVFKPGKKNSPEDYNGGRTTNDIVQYAKNLAAASAPPRPIVQLTSDSALDKTCSEGLCLIAWLPHIMDGGVKVRQSYLSVLQALAKKYATRPFSYLWSEAGAQNEFEGVLDRDVLGGNAIYPSLTAFHKKKGRYAHMTGSFTVESISDFLKTVLSGKTPTIDLPKKEYKIEAVTAWDGKEAPKQEL